MRHVSENAPSPGAGARRSRLVALVAFAAACLLSLAVAGTALAVKEPVVKEDFAPFADCPTASSAICIVSNTTGGEFQLGKKAVPIPEGTVITLQGGLPLESYVGQTLIEPLDGKTLSETPLTVPGGLVGIGGLGGEVTATAELAGSIEVNRANLAIPVGPAVTLPLKVHLQNEVLGEECYIGSDAEPVVLHLTVGKTAPPAPAESIEGHRNPIEYKDKKRLVYIPNNTLVDNNFAVPGVTGCGGALSAIIDPIVNLDIGLPAKAGESKVLMMASLEETASKWAAKYKPKVKKAKKEKAS
ncbi:MAG TPA: hypothetical protein VHW67_06060 [Solirubrobacteraceae bacterium]|nr:hypothetical protein [Solirubrobacteraceae bacterium]